MPKALQLTNVDLTGLEPASRSALSEGQQNPGRTVPFITPLSYRPKCYVKPTGFEPAPTSLKGWRPGQLVYGSF